MTTDHEWLSDQFANLTEESVEISPSEWAEANRVLPAGTTALPGPYRFAVAPYLREILDCMGVNSPIREVALMKGVQTCGTSGIIENSIGYDIAHVKTAPAMFLTADAELAKLRVEGNIQPMIRESNLQDRIRSNDTENKKKTGNTAAKIEWIGGGFLIPFGAINANKLRSIPIQRLYRDEIDAFPLYVGKDGDPMALSFDRTATFEDSRKILDISTPLLKGTSRIEKRFLLGDQRKYFVCCLGCGHSQELKWNRVDENGVVSGIVWELDEAGLLVPDSVRYLCEKCGHAHTNDDKVRLLDPSNGAEWRPTATPSAPHIRSYHISALYSPVGMQSWEACVRKWLEAWDPVSNTPRDVTKLQVFYNNVLGVPFEMIGEKVSFAAVSGHRRQVYHYGEIPNQFAATYAGSPILLVTCAVDVHADSLKIGVFGWARGGRPFLIDYWDKPGDTTNLESENWKFLQGLIDSKVYTADDGRNYRIQLTLIDAGFRGDDVSRFCQEYQAGVYPIRGVSTPPRGAPRREFSSYVTKLGATAFNVTVDIYKDRWSAALRRSWDGSSMFQEWFFSAPMDATDRQLKELTVERKVELKDKRTGQRIGFEWHRPPGSANELWDLLIYNSAALEMIAANVCISLFEQESVNWVGFWNYVQTEEPYIFKG